MEILIDGEPLSELQKIMLRMALENREAAGVVVRKVLSDYEIWTGDGEGNVIDRQKHQSYKLESPDKEDWVDLKDTYVIQQYFGIAYTLTFEEVFGIYTGAKDKIESKQYHAAEKLIHDDILELADEFRLVESYLCGPSSWSGLPRQMAFNLHEEGVEIAKKLRCHADGKKLDLSQLEPELMSSYRHELEQMGVPEDQVLPERTHHPQNPPWTEIPIGTTHTTGFRPDPKTPDQFKSVPEVVPASTPAPEPAHDSNGTSVGRGSRKPKSADASNWQASLRQICFAIVVVTAFVGVKACFKLIEDRQKAIEHEQSMKQTWSELQKEIHRPVFER